MNEDLVVLFSGGADSTLLLKMAREMGKKPFAVMIDYGQLHIEELEFAKRYLDRTKIENMTIKIDGYNINSALTGNGEKNLYEGVNIHHVAQRNTIFISIAAGVAESKNIDEIWYGANHQDLELNFPDCLQQYIEKMNKLLEISGSKPIKIYAPLLGMEKYMIKSLMKQYDINEDEVFSGYGEFA
jgi:7-cyano-7-deazaguanine synthase